MTPTNPLTGFVDLQVNGYAGVDFNSDDLTADAFGQVCERLEADGVAAFCPTVITAPLDAMQRRIRRIAELRESDDLARRLIAGIHVEGPFISPDPGYVGAHPAEAVRPADPDTADRLLEAGQGLVRLFTLAPEHDPDLRTTGRLADRGVTVSAGHCNPSLGQLRAAIDAGLTMFTHLGNGCPKQLDRHDNIIQRALSLSDRLFISFIADGVHIPTHALRNYLRCVDTDRALIVTDAMAAAACPPGRYQLAGRTIDVGEDGAARLPGSPYLAGSAATMPASAALLTDQLGLPSETAVALTIDNPRRAVPII